MIIIAFVPVSAGLRCKFSHKFPISTMFYGKISLIHENLVVFWEISAIFAVKVCFKKGRRW